MGSFRRIVKRNQKPGLTNRQVKLASEIFEKVPETQSDKDEFVRVFSFIDRMGCTVDDYLEQNKEPEDIISVVSRALDKKMLKNMAERAEAMEKYANTPHGPRPDNCLGCGKLRKRYDDNPISCGALDGKPLKYEDAGSEKWPEFITPDEDCPGSFPHPPGSIGG